MGRRELALLMGLRGCSPVLAATDPRWLGEHALSPSRLRGVIGISGPYDIHAIGTSGRIIGPHVIETAFGDDPDVLADASPIRHVGEGPLPRFLITSAEHDNATLRTQHAQMVTRLTEAHAHVETFQARGARHIGEIQDIGEPGNPLGETVARFILAP